MIGDKQKLFWGLVVLLAAEIALFSRSFSLFFCGDSLYYLSRRLESLSDVVKIFSSIDHLEEYRPLPFILFSFVYYPVFKLNAFGYHFVPLTFHILNTYLVFLLLRRLLKTSLGAYVGAFYFGIHSVNFFITFDMTMLTDFTYAFFYLLAILLFLKYLDAEKGIWIAGGVLAFALALLAKEAAITLIATVTLSAILYLDKKHGQGPLLARLLHVTNKNWPFLALALTYTALLLFIKDGTLYPQRVEHPHHVSLSLQTLATKYKYLLWAFNLPESLTWNRAALSKLLVAGGIGLFGGICLLYFVRSWFVRNKVVFCGAVWFFAALSPVLFFSNLTMMHYLYVPVIGLGLILGSLVETSFAYLRANRALIPARAGFVIFLVLNLNATWANITTYMADSWLSDGAEVAETCLNDLKNARPDLPPDATLYFLKSIEKDLPWFLDYGRMFNVFYGKDSMKTLFADRGAKLPPEYLDDDRVVILRFVRPHLYDVTNEFRSEMRDKSSIRLIQFFGEENIYFNEKEAYARSDVFDTPTRTPAFVMPLARANVGREALITIAGARVRFDIPLIENNCRLTFGITKAFDTGDGAEARVYFEYEQKKDLLYSRSFNPAHDQGDRCWFDEVIDLSKYFGKQGALIFECNSGPQGDVVADWLAWSNVKLLRSPGVGTESAPSNLPSPAWIHFIPSYARQGEYVIVTVGNGSHMTIDCKYRLNGTERIRQKWFTGNAAGQFVFEPTEAGKWEIIAIKNSLSRDWIAASASLVVDAH